MKQYTLSPDEIILAPDDEKIDEPKLLIIGLGQAKILLKDFGNR